MNTKQDLLNSFKKSYKLEEGNRNRKHKQSLYSLDKHPTTSSKTGDVVQVLYRVITSRKNPSDEDVTALRNSGLIVFDTEPAATLYIRWLIENGIIDANGIQYGYEYRDACNLGIPDADLEGSDMPDSPVIIFNPDNFGLLFTSNYVVCATGFQFIPVYCSHVKTSKEILETINTFLTFPLDKSLSDDFDIFQLFEETFSKDI